LAAGEGPSVGSCEISGIVAHPPHGANCAGDQAFDTPRAGP